MAVIPGVVIVDGDVQWIIDDARETARVGDIIFAPAYRNGFIVADGRKVAISKYPRLFLFVIKNSLLASEEDYKTDCSKYVYYKKEEVLKVPNMIGRVLQGGLFKSSRCWTSQYNREYKRGCV